MSNYSKATNFASKDSLSTGNPLKIVKGTELDTEFNSIATAIATKLDGTFTNFAFTDRKSTRLNSSHVSESRMPSSA